jgi:RNA polymerase sigma-70 factor (ECF subfamily)
MVYFKALPAGESAEVDGVARPAAGHSSAWLTGLLDRYGPQVRNKLCAILGHGPDVDDAYQSALCQLAAQAPATIASNPGGYFYRTALNAAIELLRARRCAVRHREEIVRRTAQSVVVDDPGAALARDEAHETLRRAIGKLPSQLRRVVLLRDLVGLPYRQVGAILGIRETTARLYRRQAIVRLGEMLGGEECRVQQGMMNAD